MKNDKVEVIKFDRKAVAVGSENPKKIFFIFYFKKFLNTFFPL